jgi:hypothetical protein
MPVHEVNKTSADAHQSFSLRRLRRIQQTGDGAEDVDDPVAQRGEDAERQDADHRQNQRVFDQRLALAATGAGPGAKPAPEG